MAQNGTSNKSGLPHGMVPFHQIPDPQTRDAVMKLNENIVALAKRIAGGGSTEPVVQYKDAQNLLNSIETNYPNAAAAAAAVSQVSQSASSAHDSAVTATAASASAAASAASAAADANALAYAVESYAWAQTDVQVSAIYPLDAIVSDPTAQYRVKVTFRNTGSTDHSVSENGIPRVRSYSGSATDPDATFDCPLGANETSYCTVTVQGAGSRIDIRNRGADVDFFVRIEKVVSSAVGG